MGALTLTPTDDAAVVDCRVSGTMSAPWHGDAGANGKCIPGSDGSRVPVKWIGRQTVSTLVSGPQTAMTRIRAGALGHSDLTVTADHRAMSSTPRRW